MASLRLENGIQLYAASMGKIFRVTHICDDTEAANAIMEKDRNTACIAEDNNGRVYLAEQYGSVCPSAILDDIRRRNQKTCK